MTCENLNSGGTALSKSSHDELRRNLTRAILSEHEATAELLRYLGEFEARGLHLRDGFSSIYGFLTLGHGYSEGAAARRAVVARFGRRFPGVIQMIAQGELSLSVADVVARAVSKDELGSATIPELIATLQHKSKTEAERIIPELGVTVSSPKSRERVRMVGRPQVTVGRSQTVATCVSSVEKTPTLGFQFAESSEVTADAHSTCGDPKSAENSPEPKPSTEYQVSLRLSEDGMRELKRAQELLGTKDLASTIEALAKFYNKRKDPLNVSPKKSSPKKSTPPAESASVKRSRYIPAPTKRTVYQASGGQCTYVDSSTGRRCHERRHLEVDHIKPFGRGGDHEPENLQILCRSHNLMRARGDYGATLVERMIEVKRRSSEAIT
jgi:hypothetical protein